MFRNYNGVKRNFELINKFFSGAKSKIDLQNLLILPLMQTEKRNKLMLQLDVLELETKETSTENLEILKEHQNKLLTDPLTYSDYIRTIPLQNLGLVKSRLKAFSSQYESYQSHYDYLKPVYNFYLYPETQQSIVNLGESMAIQSQNESLNTLDRFEDVFITPQDSPLAHETAFKKVNFKQEEETPLENKERKTEEKVSVYRAQILKSNSGVLNEMMGQQNPPPAVNIEKDTHPNDIQKQINDNQDVASTNSENFQYNDGETIVQETQRTETSKNNNKLVTRIQVQPESSNRQDATSKKPDFKVTQSDLEKTQPVLKKGNPALALHALHEKKTPNPRVKEFGVFEETPLSSSRKFQIVINSSERRRTQVTPPKNKGNIEKLDIPEQAIPQVEEISENLLQDELRSPSRPTKDTDLDASNYSSIYSYDSQFQTYKKSNPKSKKNPMFKLDIANLNNSTNGHLTFMHTQKESMSQRNFAKFEIPMFTIVCDPHPTPIMNEAFFLNKLNLPNPAKLPKQLQPQFDSVHSQLNIEKKVESANQDKFEKKKDNSKEEAQSNISLSTSQQSKTQISLSPSYRTPSTEGIYSTNSNLYYLNIVKHHELNSPETRVKMKELGNNWNIYDSVYFGQSELAFVYDRTKKSIIAVDLKGYSWVVCEIKGTGKQFTFLESIICPQLGPINGYRNYNPDLTLSPKKKLTKLNDVKQDIQEALEWDYRVKDLLLAKVDDYTLDVIYGFDYCFSNTPQSATKLINSTVKNDSPKKKKTLNGRKFNIARITELQEEHGEIVDFKGYWLNPILANTDTNRSDEPKAPSSYIPEARVYVLGSKGWVGIYCLKFEDYNSPEIFCIKEIEICKGSKCRAVKFDISEPQVIGDWENEAGYSPYKQPYDDEISPDLKITYEQQSRIIAISFESVAGTRKFKQQIFFFRLLPETYSLSLLFYKTLRSSDPPSLDKLDKNSPKKKEGIVLSQKISSFSLNFKGFFLLSFFTHLEIFSFRHNMGKVYMQKETDFIGQESQFQNCVYCPFEREDDKGRLWWVSRDGLLSSLEEGWGMKEWKITERLQF